MGTFNDRKSVFARYCRIRTLGCGKVPRRLQILIYNVSCVLFRSVGRHFDHSHDDILNLTSFFFLGYTQGVRGAKYGNGVWRITSFFTCIFVHVRSSRRPSDHDRFEHTHLVKYAHGAFWSWRQCSWSMCAFKYAPGAYIDNITPK